MKPFEDGRTLPARSLDFWFDYTCPYAYLGSTQAPALAAQMGVSLTYRPLLLGGVFRAQGTPQKLFATLSPAKAAHNLADLQRWARRFGVSLTMPANHPMRSVEALRATLATKLDPRLIDALFRAYWVENADIGSREVLGRVLAACGHDADRVLEAIETPAIKDDLRARTDEAVALGIFGVPTWVVDGAHLYWGQDRLPFVAGTPAAPVPVPVPEGSPAARPTLTVYWDFSSPFAYLGAARVTALAASLNATIVWRPVLLGGLFRAIGAPDVPLATFSEAKRSYILEDLARWAAYIGAPLRFPSTFPVHSLRALRVYLALPEARRAAYRDAVFRAAWADDRDIANPPVLAAAIGDERVAAEAFARAESDEVKAELRQCTEHAIAEGVFGVPTFVVTSAAGERELFWGQDRLELACDALARS
jgi:2-hydroxychromene-2-carboxylate isomerase